jgi:RHS repeat-associated protein
MKGATVSTGTYNYLYNAFEQRVVKYRLAPTTPILRSYYVSDEAGHVLFEYDASGYVVFETVCVGDLPVAALTPLGTSTSVAYIYADHLNTARVIARSTDHAIVWQWGSNEPFGTTQAATNPRGLGTYTCDQRFPGQVADSETAWNDDWNRDYNPALGRYVQSDPIGLASGSMSTYGYVDGNPLAFVDPEGLQALPMPVPPPPMRGGYSPMPGAGSNGGSLLNDGPGLGRERETADQARSRETRCPPNKPCPPCRTVSGRVVPVDTLGYRPLDGIPNDQVQHGVAGSHHNIFVAKQNPNNCQCFWSKQSYVLKPGQLPASAVPVEPFAN